MTRHRFHALCPYFAMFPETFAEKWIAELTRPGDVVIDPFCGRGTVPFQALLMGRRSIGVDTNQVAYCVSRAKTAAPRRESVKRRLRELEKIFAGGDWEAERRRLPPFFRRAYAPSTLRQILFLRERLDWKRRRTDCMLAAIALGALHGETETSQSYLSNQMPRTISTKPAYSIRFWESHGHVAPDRDAFSLLADRIDFRYRDDPPEGEAYVVNGDMRDLPRLAPQLPVPVRAAITSPPYLDVTNFEEDQWLRLWFLGGPPYPTPRRVSPDDRHWSGRTYWPLIADMWRVLGSVVKAGGHVVVRIGATKLSPDQVRSSLVGAARVSPRHVRLVSWEVSEIQRRQTDAFRPGTSGCRLELDCHFQLR